MKTVQLNKMRRDGVFKALHQRLAPPNYYALDADLILVEKIPPSTVYVVAHLEFKMDTEPISFTQAVCFNQMTSAPLPWCIPVYIIRAHEPFVVPPTDANHLSHDYCEYALENHRFDIAEYLHADWKPKPPRVSVATVAKNIKWRELIEWERKLRQARRAQLAPYINAGWQTQHAAHAAHEQGEIETSASSKQKPNLIIVATE
jgi:hypothetical protein